MRQTRDGFTLAEALVVIAIIVVLAAAAVPSGMGVQRNVKQIQLNRSAETIYMTAQRNLVMTRIDAGHSPAPTPPSETFVTSASGIDAKNPVLPANTITPALYNAHWVIQYKGWTIKTVYYSETEELETESDLTKWKADQTGKVGWYGE